MKDADSIIAQCPQDGDDHIFRCGAEQAQIHMIPCGCDDAEFTAIPKESARRSIGVDPSERLLVYVGRVAPHKGIDTTIAGFARLVRDHGVLARLLIVGSEWGTPEGRPPRKPLGCGSRQVWREWPIA